MPQGVVPSLVLAVALVSVLVLVDGTSINELMLVHGPTRWVIIGKLDFLHIHCTKLKVFKTNCSTVY